MRFTFTRWVLQTMLVDILPNTIAKNYDLLASRGELACFVELIAYSSEDEHQLIVVTVSGVYLSAIVSHNAYLASLREYREGGE